MDEDEISEEAKAEIAHIRAEQKADPRKDVSRAEAAEILGVSTNSIERLEKSDELVASSMVGGGWSRGSRSTREGQAGDQVQPQERPEAEAQPVLGRAARLEEAEGDIRPGSGGAAT